MISRSASTPVRRHLSFNDLPFRGQCFYLDIKTAAVKNKLTERIQELGGSVEGFLSRDLSLIITDRDSEKVDTGHVNGKSVLKSGLPLSRGQALLKAAQHQGSKDGHGQDFLKNASNLGIKTQKVSSFLHVTSKLLSKVKSKKKKNEEENYMEGMSPISWDKDKENSSIIKVEDNESLYRPLFKQFDIFPQLDYNQSSSPFDVGIVLTKEKENNNNQLKKKSVVGVVKGGYCESCDHWYKCTLREHLKSEKHRAFVKSVDNFRSLDSLTTSLPNLRSFLGKHGLQNVEESNHTVSNGTDFNFERNNGSSAYDKELISELKFPKFETTDASTTDVLTNKDSSLMNVNVHNGRPDLSVQIMDSSISEAGRNSRDDVYNISSNKSTQDICKSERSVSSDRRMTLTQVLKNVFDADDAVADNFSAGVDMDKDNSVQLEFNNTVKECRNIDDTTFDQSKKVVSANGTHRHIQPLYIDAANSDLPNLPNDIDKAYLTNDKVFETKASSLKSHKSETQASLDTLMHDSGSLRLAPEATFSSSCSFGENGVGEVLNFLQSNESNSDHSSALVGKSESNKSLSMKQSGSERTLKHYGIEGSLSEKSFKSNSYLSNISCNINKSKISSESSTECASFKNRNVFGYISKLKHCFGDLQNDSSTQPYLETSEPRGVPVSESLYSSSGLSRSLRYSASGESSTINFSKIVDYNRKNDSESGTWNYANKSSLGSIPSFAADPKNDTFIDNSNVLSDNLTMETAQSLTLKVSPERMCDDSKIDSETTPRNKGLTQPCLQDLCRSGSSIRNWLLPKDEDSRSVRTAVSKLDHTLMEMENSPIVTEAKTESNLDDNKETETLTTRPPDEEETCSNNFVASWIQTQKFYENSKTESIHEDSVVKDCSDEQNGNIEDLCSLSAVHSSNWGEHHSVSQCHLSGNIENHGSLSAAHSSNLSEQHPVSHSHLSGNIENLGSLSTINPKDWSEHHPINQGHMIENLGSLGSVHSRNWSDHPSVSKSYKTESSLHVGSASEMLNKVQSDSCSYTSISDCTIYKDFNQQNVENVPSESFKTAEHSENISSYTRATQKIISDDALSDISGVSSCVTDRGIKIKGLLALKKENCSSKGSLLDGRASSCSNDFYVKSQQLGNSIGTNSINPMSDYENISETNSSCFNNSGALSNVPHTEAVGLTSNQVTMAAKTKTLKTQKKPKTTQAKKKTTKNSRSSKQKTKVSEDLHKQILSNTPSHLQNPYLLQTMYSPISQPSECAPTDPMSPYNPHVWKQQQQRYFVPSQQTFSSPQFEGGFQTQLFPSQHMGRDQLPSGHPLPISSVQCKKAVSANENHWHLQPLCTEKVIGRSVDLNHRLNPGIHSPMPQSPVCYSSPQPGILTSQHLGIAQQSHVSNNAQHFSSASPYSNSHTFLPANNHLNVQIPETGFHTSIVDFLSSPKANTLTPLTHHSPFIGTNDNQAYSQMTTNSVLSNPNNNISANMAVYGQTDANTSLGPAFGFSPGMHFTQNLPNMPTQQTFQSIQQNTELSQQHNKQLSTICLDDIAEDENSNLSYNDAYRYAARRKRNCGSTLKTQGSVNKRQVTNSEHNVYGDKHQQNEQIDGNGFATKKTFKEEKIETLSASPLMSNLQNTSHVDSSSCNPNISLKDQYQNANTGENSNIYDTISTDDTQQQLPKMSASLVREPKSNLTHYWNVRKTGECRLVFSMNLVGKRKAEEETPGKQAGMSPVTEYSEVVGNDPPQAKRRRCLVF